MKRLFSSLISVLIIFIVSCNAKEQPEQTKNEIGSSNIDVDTSKMTIINESNMDQAYGKDNVNNFKQFADSVIRVALNRKSIAYVLNIDTLTGAQTKNVYNDYFDSDSLKKVILLRFTLPSPNTRFSFNLLLFEYTSPTSAFLSLNKVATIAYSSYFGLNKEPAYVFRINNHLFCLSTPNTLSGKTFNALKNKFGNQFKPKPLDELENHIQFSTITEFGQENINGKWKLKLISPIFQNDTTKKKGYEHCIIEIQDNILHFDNIQYPINQITKLKLPDVQTFFIYNELIWCDSLILNPVLKKFKGPVIKYSLFFKDPISLMDKKFEHELFGEQPLRNFIKISEKEFGFIKDNAYYTLMRIN